MNQMIIVAYNTADAYWLSQYNEPILTQLLAVPPEIYSEVIKYLIGIAFDIFLGYT
ncbi:MAG: hypothetical protein QXH24_06360 [Candidatus Bathyarchaeia archaeon]